MDFLRIFVFGPPEFFADFVTGSFLFRFCGEKVPRKILQENPRQNPPNFYTTKTPTHFCRGAGGGHTSDCLSPSAPKEQNWCARKGGIGIARGIGKGSDGRAIRASGYRSTCSIVTMRKTQAAPLASEQPITRAKPHDLHCVALLS